MNNFEFWKMSYDYGWVTLDDFKKVIASPMNPNGEITLAQFQEITEKDTKQDITRMVY